MLVKYRQIGGEMSLKYRWNIVKMSLNYRYNIVKMRSNIVKVSVKYRWKVVNCHWNIDKFSFNTNNLDQERSTWVWLTLMALLILCPTSHQQFTYIFIPVYHQPIKKTEQNKNKQVDLLLGIFICMMNNYIWLHQRFLWILGFLLFFFLFKYEYEVLFC